MKQKKSTTNSQNIQTDPVRRSARLSGRDQKEADGTKNKTQSKRKLDNDHDADGGDDQSRNKRMKNNSNGSQNTATRGGGGGGRQGRAAGNRNEIGNLKEENDNKVPEVTMNDLLAFNLIEKEIQDFETLSNGQKHKCGDGVCVSGSRLAENIRNILKDAFMKIQLNQAAETTRPKLFARRMKHQLNLNPYEPSSSSYVLSGYSSNSNSPPFSMKATPEQKALGNALIVQNILSHFDTEELLNLRTVTKVWEKEATSHLLANKHQQVLQVRFSWSDSAKNFQHICLGSLSEFNEDCWKASRRFPCAQFHFEGGDLNSPDVVQFLSENGSSIKSLILNQSFFSSMTIYRNLFFKWTPNLKFLSLKSVPLNTEGKLLEENEDEKEEVEEQQEQKANTVKHKPNGMKQKNKPPRVLPSLEILHLLVNCDDDSESSALIEENGDFVQDILKSAPQLKLVTDPNRNFTEKIVSARKFHLIEKVLEWEFSATNINRFTRFANGSPQLQKLTLKMDSFRFSMPDEVSELVSSLNTLFQSSKSSLKELTLYEELIIFLGLQLPVLRTVEDLFIKDVFLRMNGKFLPEGQKISDVFPSLDNLSIKNIESDNSVSPLFCTANASPSVTKLFLSNAYATVFQPSWITKAAIYYPNVKNLRITLYHDLTVLPEVCRAIWTAGFSNLEEICIRSETDSNSLGSGLPGEMDAVITGIPLEKCKQLRRNWKPEMEGKVEEVTRENPSIFNMTKLKKLHFSGWFIGTKNDQVFSHVASLYAFHPLSERQEFEAIVKRSNFTNISAWTKPSEYFPSLSYFAPYTVYNRNSLVDVEHI